MEYKNDYLDNLKQKIEKEYNLRESLNKKLVELTMTFSKDENIDLYRLQRSLLTEITDIALSIK